MWAGKVSWLRRAFQAPPPLLHDAEDFWISAVLKRDLGLRTKRPRCPSQEMGGDLELCACSMKCAAYHRNAVVGSTEYSGKEVRRQAMKTLASHYNYTRILSKQHLALEEMGAQHVEHPVSSFDISPEFKMFTDDCLFWY